MRSCIASGLRGPLQRGPRRSRPGLIAALRSKTWVPESKLRGGSSPARECVVASRTCDIGPLGRVHWAAPTWRAPRYRRPEPQEGAGPLASHIERPGTERKRGAMLTDATMLPHKVVRDAAVGEPNGENATFARSGRGQVGPAARDSQTGCTRQPP